MPGDVIAFVAEAESETVTVEETVIRCIVSGQGPPGSQGPIGPAGPAAATLVKAGEVLPGAFTGSPRRTTVTFGTPYPDDDYVIGVCFETVDNLQLTHAIENKAAAGFDIVLCVNNLAGLACVGWSTTPLGN